MKKLATVVPNVRSNLLFCCSTAIFLTSTAVAAPTGESVGLAKLAPPTASTKHLYVAQNGSDSNPGTEDKPLATIARADARASAGYTIHVAPGIYRVSAPASGSIGIKTSKSGTPTARIRFVSDVPRAARIVMSGTGVAWRAKGDYVDIEGFDISGTGRGGILAEGARMTITKNFIHDLTVSGGCNGSGGAAIDTWGPGGNSVVDSNVVRNIGVQWIASGSCNTVQGIYIANQNNRVSNNVVSGVAAVGINSWHAATASTIVNNTVFHSRMGINIGHGDSGATAAGTQNNYVANNIIYDTNYGISEMGRVGGNNRYVNNLVARIGTKAWRVKGSVSGAIASDPLFVDYQPNGTGNYRLLSSSPAIDRGTSVNAPAADFAGVARPRGAAVDLGAYEF
jgi:hypothetical protein